MGVKETFNRGNTVIYFLLYLFDFTFLATCKRMGGKYDMQTKEVKAKSCRVNK